MSTQCIEARHGAKDETIRVGVYICHCGGNIADVVDVEKVVQAAAKLPDVVIARRNMFMCSDQGQNLVAEDIKKEKLNRVVVAACSPSLHELTFRGTLQRSGLNPYLYEHANIREQVSWCAKSDPVGATDKAIRLVAAAVGKARNLRRLERIRIDAEKHVVVVGGGVSGLRAARDLSRRGMRVTLLERSPFLGGRMAQLDKVYPTGEKARALLSDLMKEVVLDSNITIHTRAEMLGTSGYLGSFHLDIRLYPRGVTQELDSTQLDAVIDICPETADNEFDCNLSKRKAIFLPYQGCYPAIPAIDWKSCTKCGKCAEPTKGKGISLVDDSKTIRLRAGAIILATGFDHYESPHGEYGYGEYPEVVTLPQLIRLLDEEGPSRGKLQINGRRIEHVCLIHCVGSRQVEGIHKPGPDGKVNAHCSRVCCTATLQAACEIKERYPDVNVYDFYQDIRTYGRGHEDYYEQASKRGVLFFRWLPEEPPVVVKSPDGKGAPLRVKVKDTLTFNEEIDVPADLVVLSSGMLPRDITALVDMLKLPRSADRFLQEVHPKLRPVELAVGGVLIAGTCQAPMDIGESTAAASAAAVKASALLAKGYIELEPFVATVKASACTGGTDCDAVCVQECQSLQAISLVEMEINGEKRKIAAVNTTVCNGCGMCVAVCPHRALQVASWEMDQFDAMVDAIVSDVA
jgi:heterodisulfide reductase subunit A